MNALDSLKYFVAINLIAASSQAFSQPDNPAMHIDDGSILAEFFNRAFISSTDARIYKDHLQDLIGMYVVVDAKGKPMLMGDHSPPNATQQPAVLKVEDGKVVRYHKEEKDKAALELLTWLRLKADNSRLIEVIVRDTAVASGNATTGSTCMEHAPKAYTTNKIYYCVAGVVLTSVTYNRYKKTGAGIDGVPNITTASGTYSMDNSTEASEIKISYTSYGPFKDGQYVGGENSLLQKSNGLPNFGNNLLMQTPGTPSSLQRTEAKIMQSKKVPSSNRK